MIDSVACFALYSKHRKDITIMTKICFPHYKGGEFESLQEAYRKLKKNDQWREYTLFDIVRYNVRYRNHYRKFGFFALMALLLYDECLLVKESDSIKYLSGALKNWKIADYDIQCYNINDEITILGQTFKGLEDIRKNVEICCRFGTKGINGFVPKENDGFNNIHVGLIYENYPTFDSFDYADNRTYQNYIFRKDSITVSDIKKCKEIWHCMNFCMLHEDIPEEMLPMLYYCGEGNYMLLTSSAKTECK